MDMLLGITFTMTANSNLVSSTAELGAGGMAFLKSQTADVIADTSGPSSINYSKAKLHGGVFFF